MIDARFKSRLRLVRFGRVISALSMSDMILITEFDILLNCQADQPTGRSLYSFGTIQDSEMLQKLSVEVSDGSDTFSSQS